LRRRDLLKNATLMAAANATPAFTLALSEPPAPEPAGRKPLPKIALEEHFMVPEFVEYFAETYQNISPEIAKMGLNTLPDFGDRRIAIMDQHHISYVVLSLAGPGVQAEKNAGVALSRAKWVRMTSLPGRSRSGRNGMAASLIWPCTIPRRLPTSLSAAYATFAFRVQ
jgi:2,3-dihydroxybenzoate decarboxylase